VFNPLSPAFLLPSSCSHAPTCSLSLGRSHSRPF
jgi:hypothetical protein